MLSPEDIKKLDEAGLGSSQPVQAPQKSLSERLGISNVSQETPKSFGDEPTFKASIGGASTIPVNVAKTIGNIPSDVANIAKTAVKSTLGQASEAAQTGEKILKDRGVVQGSKDIAGGFADTLTKIGTAPGEALVKKNDKMDLVQHLSPIQDQTLKQVDLIYQKILDAKKTGDTSKLQILQKALKYAMENLDAINSEIGSKEDRANQVLDTLTNVAKYPIEHPAQTAIVAESLPKDTQTAISKTLKPVTQSLETGVTATKNAIIKTPSVVKEKVSNIFTSKTPQEILSTPEDKLHKLNKSERDYYFKNQTDTINQKSTALETKVKDNLVKATEKTQAEAEALQRKLEVASRDEVVRLRPKIVKAMGEQSKTYRNLINEEMAGKENIPINKGELVQHIESQYSDNPELAKVIKDKLGVGELTNEGQATIHLDKDTTLGELFNKTKALKQEVSASAKAGTKVFTSSDKLTDDAIHTLTDFMKTKGVDFKEANQFWSKYAPIRNQLVAESKPFLQTETQTGRFAKTLQRVAEGKDVNNENFIKEVEKLLKEPVGKDTKAIIKNLSATEKQQAIQEIEAQAAKAKIKMDAELSKKGLDKLKLATEQKILWNRVFKGIVVTALTGTAYEVGKKAAQAAGL